MKKTDALFAVFAALSLAVAAPAQAMGKGAPMAVKTVLFIGDSHSVGTFGHQLDGLIRAEHGLQVATYASCGSSPSWWTSGQPTTCGFFQKTEDGTASSGTNAPTPLLSDLIAAHHPDFVVVEQGTNFVGSPADYQQSTSQALADVITAAHATCVWVGPPKNRVQTDANRDATYVVLEAVAKQSGCVFVDSRPFVEYPATGGDGLHFDSLGPAGVALAQQWALDVFNAISATTPNWP